MSSNPTDSIDPRRIIEVCMDKCGVPTARKGWSARFEDEAVDQIESLIQAARIEEIAMAFTGGLIEPKYAADRLEALNNIGDK